MNGDDILALLEEMHKEIRDHGMTEHAEALWHKALMLHRERNPNHDPNDPVHHATDEDLPAMLRPQAM